MWNIMLLEVIGFADRLVIAYLNDINPYDNSHTGFNFIVLFDIIESISCVVVKIIRQFTMF